MSKTRELCDDCSGLGCFTCGLTGFVEVEATAEPPDDPRLITGNGLPSPQLISPWQIFSPGSRAIRFVNVPLPCSFQDLTDNHERTFRLRVLRVGPVQFGGAMRECDIELVPF